MTANTAPETGSPKLSLSTSRIVFLVVAAAAPMAAMVGNVPLALKLGKGHRVLSHKIPRPAE